MIKKLFIFFLLILIVTALLGGVLVFWGYNYITRDLPQLDRVQDYQPAMVSQVLARDGSLVAEFYTEKRYPVSIKEVPLIVRQAFLASEDAKFYSHPGIDLMSIFRAFIKNIQTGSARQGGSTITQQVVKNLLLTSQKKLERKIKEALLAYRLEQSLSKDEIFQIYLNQIFFGNGAHGIKAAAKLYFDKELKDLTTAEAALLAGLPQAPSRYSPLSNPKLAQRRQRYVLGQMVDAGFIERKDADLAAKEELKFYKYNPQTILESPHYVTEVRKIFLEKFPQLNVDTDGYTIETALDPVAYEMAESALRKGLEELDKRRGWRGVKAELKGISDEKFLSDYKIDSINKVKLNEKIYALVKSIAGDNINVLLGDGNQYTVSLKGVAWANRYRNSEDQVRSISISSILKIGDVIEVSRISTDKQGTPIFQIDQTPDAEGAIVLLHPATGEVYATVGGYDFNRSQFNRATQSYRQPGSAFKPIVYLAAIDGFGYTPASIVYDEPRTFKIGNTFWTPGNFDRTFLGPITLRTALQKSRNIVSADIISRIGVESVIQYARKMGLEGPIGANLSISLGSSEVTLLELSRAYGVFPNQGVLMPSIFITRVLDREGKEIYRAVEEQIEKTKRVISPATAFVMSNLMRGVVQNGTAWRVRELERPAAGKTGTSNGLMDTWFIGFTPEWVCGVWAGFDLKKSLGSQETGGKVSAPIFLDFMKAFLERQEQKSYAELVEVAKAEAEQIGIEYEAPEKPLPEDFEVPEGVVSAWVNKNSGRMASEGAPNAMLDYFVEGTEPSESSIYEETTNYLEIPEL